MTRKTDEASGEANSLPTLIESLYKKYQLLDREYHTWPFEASVFKGFGATVLMPLLSAFASYLMDVYLR